MRKFIAELAEGLIIGIVMGATIGILGIEITLWEIIILIVAIIIATSIARGIRNSISKGKIDFLPKYEWTYQFGKHKITVKASKAEELYINDKLVDKKTGISFPPVELNGLLDTGEKITAVLTSEKLRKAISEDSYLCCELLINDNTLQEFIASDS